MIVSVHDAGTEAIFDGRSTKRSRKTLPTSLHAIAQRKLDLLNTAAALSDLRVPPRNRLEKLVGDRKGQHSIRINDQYRICFVWTDGGPERVEITDAP
ncbi:MAG: type II toxin-antitoxin system RelE/ParE family toxin [Rubricoccaceae bacterium]|nr:type II toxin-antitoxin system RelE/ParE family toxin [Rubricoccaceae bacterium]